MSERSTKDLVREFEQATLDAKQMRLDWHTGSGYTTRADVDRANADRDAALSALLSRIAELEKDRELADAMYEAVDAAWDYLTDAHAAAPHVLKAKQLYRAARLQQPSASTEGK